MHDEQRDRQTPYEAYDLATRHELGPPHVPGQYGTPPPHDPRPDPGWRQDRTRPLQDSPLQSGASTDDVTLRFGPGVAPGLAEKWRYGARRRSPLPRRIAGGLTTLSLAVLSGVLVWWLLHSGSAVRVTGIRVSAPAGMQHCGATANIVGVIQTTGGPGEISYRWRRNDGQDSGILTDSVARGRRSIRVPLHWTVQGTGTFHAVAVLQVISPRTATATASATFDYTCR